MRLLAGVLMGIVILSAYAVQAGPATADADVVFVIGCDLYEQGEFDQAADHFEVLVARGIQDADVYYNLGNAYYKQGQLGKAVVNYRRALLLTPRDEDTKFNLELLRTIIGFRDTTASYDVGAVVSFPIRLASPREIQLVFYVCYYLTALAFLVALFTQGLIRRRAFRAFVVLAVIAAASFGFAHYGLSMAEGHSNGVVIVDQADMMSGPGTAFDEVLRLPDGVEVSLKARSGIWVEVQLRTGEVGWIREQDIELI
jgi:tetratricopeptide (TPR) repeat protein